MSLESYMSRGITWHYRYVGKEYAQDIYKKGLCLEQYLEQWGK